MRSKKSKIQKPPLPKLLAEHISSERELAKIAKTLSEALQAGDTVFLEGVMGVGKTTFTRELLLALGVSQPPEGSPTFPIAHEYQSSAAKKPSIVHLDLYRLRDEAELDDAGIPEYFEDPSRLVFVEWGSQFPVFVEKLLTRAGKRHWQVDLRFCAVHEVQGVQGESEHREISITQLGSLS